MKPSYQIMDRKDSRGFARYLARNGQLLLPLVELIEASRLAVDELIDVLGRASIEAVLQKPGYPKSRLPFVMTLEECPNSLVERALEELRGLDFLVEPILSLPLLR